MGDYLNDQQLNAFAFWFFEHEESNDAFIVGRGFSRVLADLFTLKNGMDAKPILPLGAYF